MYKFKLILLVIALLVMVLLVLGCSGGEEKAEGTDTKKADETETAVTEDPKKLPEPKLVKYDLEGRTFNILVQKSIGWVNSRDFAVDPALSGEPINDAAQGRIIAVEEFYNCVIQPIYSASVVSDARKDILADGKEYDLIMPGMTDASQIAGEGLLVDLNKIDTLHFNMPWWSKNSSDNLSVMHKLFYTLGDISIIHNDGLAVMAFNKFLIDSNDMEMPYQHVYDNTWTFDKLYDVCKGFNRDLDGDGVFTGEDQFGLITDKQNIIFMIYAGGEQLTKKDSNDIPYPAINNNPRIISIIDKIVAFFNDPTAFAETTVFGGDYSNVADVKFMENKFLFRLTSMNHYTLIREMESDFGFIPIPKLDEQQESYHHTYSYASPGVAIPVSVLDPEETGAVLEALAYHGRLLLLPAYYEINLQTKITRDDDSVTMLDIIFDTAMVDLGWIYDFGGIRGMFPPFVLKNENTFTSAYAAIESKIEAGIEKLINTFRELEAR